MWQCPMCKRKFKNTNQSHYCIKPESIDDYISTQGVEVQSIIQKVCEVIREAVPECSEIISCHMPTFRKGMSKSNLVQLAAHKNHLSFYPSENAVNIFADRLTREGYKFNKGCIHFPWNKPMPYELNSEIAHYRAGQLK